MIFLYKFTSHPNNDQVFAYSDTWYKTKDGLKLAEVGFGELCGIP